MKPDWILAASATEARLLQQEEGSPLVVLRAFHHPASRLHSSALGDDERGRQRRDGGHGAMAFEGHLEPQRKEHLHFARELAAALEEGATQGRCRHIQVYASSPFLGELRQALGDATRRLLAGSHDLDLSGMGLAEIEQRLRHAGTPAR